MIMHDVGGSVNRFGHWIVVRMVLPIKRCPCGGLGTKRSRTENVYTEVRQFHERGVPLRRC
jgi:hypothetical protein